MNDSTQITFQNNEEERKQIMGGSARKDDCNSKDKDACFGTYSVEVSGTIKQGKYEWNTFPHPISSGCFCTIC